MWHGRAEYCPLLSAVVAPDVILPGVAVREAVEAEIDQAKVTQATFRY
jgi:hypothetical protein